MNIVTPEQMAQMDRDTIASGIPGIDLMEKAGEACTEAILKCANRDEKVLILCGSGNNGGDGLVIARLLKEKRMDCALWIIGDGTNVSEDNALNQKRYEAVGGTIGLGLEKQEDLWSDILDRCTMIVDCVFGTGLKERPLPEAILKLFKTINRSRRRVIAVDIPSGLHGEKGFCLGTALLAERTLAIQNIKTGHLLGDGPDVCGEMEVLDIGILQETVQHRRLMTTKADLVFPQTRRKNTHKYHYGSIAVVAGSSGMLGAGLLAAAAALKTGAGLVTLYVPQTVVDPVMIKARPEIMVEAYETAPSVAMLKPKTSTVLFGPGIGRNRDDRIFLEELTDFTGEVIIDADGLIPYQKTASRFTQKNKVPILTPHLGELATLTGYSAEACRRDTLAIAEEWAQKHKALMVVKGYRSLTLGPEGLVYFNPTGNPGMATAGSGDVLAGMIAAVVAQRGATTAAVATAVYHHGKAGDLYAKKYGETGLTAGDLIENLEWRIRTD
ncbi:MAG: NAD(P)H-hydrate dehydratase [Eubacteriaceae bacterium]|jgi:NAD(P)H-hydrate epimerase|nr:NAD(P)H-hydrate dehydratase [Eubacteriaceae bacterium]